VDRIPQKVVVNSRQLDGNGMVGAFVRQAADRGIEVEQQRAIPIVGHHALQPEEQTA
jgi:hypothetical protein